jgi:RNA polymerase sigma factor (sigma-70 family)
VVCHRVAGAGQAARGEVAPSRGPNGLINDVVAELLAVADANPGYFKDDAHVLRCANAAAKNRKVNYVKKMALERQHMVAEREIDFEALTTGSGEDEVLEQLDVDMRAEKAFSRLPPRCRQVIEWRAMGYRIPEIARLLSISISAVKQSAKRGDERLASWLLRKR